MERKRERPVKKLDPLIENLAQDRARGINAQTLRAQGMIEESVNWGNLYNLLTDEEIIVMENRTEEIRKEEESKRLNQLSFADMENYEPETPHAGQSFVHDPEAKLNKLHQIQKRFSWSRVLNYDIEATRRQQLKDKGYTQANFRLWTRIGMEEAIARLKEKGVWWLIDRPGELGIEGIKTFVEMIRGDVVPLVDLDSSEGFRIYPSEAAWLRDLFFYEQVGMEVEET